MRATPAFFALTSAILFGLATPATKPLIADFGPFALAGFLYLGAALSTARGAFRAGNRPVWKSNRRTRALLLGAIVFGGILGPLLLLFGLQTASAADVSLWLNLELVATAALGHLIFRDRLGTYGGLAVLAVLLGAIALTGIETTAFLPAILVGLAALCWGFDNHFTSLIDGIHPSQSTFWKGIIGGTTNLAIGAAFVTTWSPGTIVAALAVGALSYGASIVLYIHGAHGLGATRAQLIFSSAPLWGLLGAATWLGERLAWLHGVAALLMAAGVALMYRDRHEHEHVHEAVTHTHSHRHDDGHHNHSHAGLPASHRHTHEHSHEPIRHRHPHWPDIHHRHKH